MIGSILFLFANWYMLAFAVVLLAIAAALYFTVGPVKLLQIVLDARTWMVILAVAAGITLYSSSQTIKQQDQKIQNQNTQNTSSGDGNKVVNHEADTKAKHVTQTEKQGAIIAAAPQGTKEDALMDEIAAEQASTPLTPDTLATPTPPSK
jgi:hypothetical protein